MLGKLLKYEFKATGRKFLPLYGVILVASIIVNFSLRFPSNRLLMVFSILVLVSLFVALGVLTLITIIQRFKNNLLSDEGYLMFTLPVTVNKLIVSKLITATAWTFSSAVISLLSFIIIFAKENYFEMASEIFRNLSGVMEFLKAEYITLAVLFAVCVFLQFIYMVLLIYTSLSVAQIAIFNKHRSFISIVAFLVMYIFISLIIGIIFNNASPLVNGSNLYEMITVLEIAVGINFVLCAIMYFATHYLLKNHLNID